MVGIVLTPPDPLDPPDPGVSHLPAGTVLHRVFGNRHEPGEFNPGYGEPARFASFETPPVPVLYAAENLEAAVCESVLHHVPAKGGVLFPEKYQDRIAAALVTTRELRLATFHGTGLRKFGLQPEQLTSCDAEK